MVADTEIGRLGVGQVCVDLAGFERADIDKAFDDSGGDASLPGEFCRAGRSCIAGGVEHLDAGIRHPVGAVAGGHIDGRCWGRPEPAARAQHHGQNMAGMGNIVARGKAYEFSHRLGHGWGRKDIEDGFQVPLVIRFFLDDPPDDAGPLDLAERGAHIAAGAGVHAIGNGIVERLWQREREEDAGEFHVWGGFSVRG